MRKFVRAVIELLSGKYRRRRAQEMREYLRDNHRRHMEALERIRRGESVEPRFDPRSPEYEGIGWPKRPHGTKPPPPPPRSRADDESGR